MVAKKTESSAGLDASCEDAPCEDAPAGSASAVDAKLKPRAGDLDKVSTGPLRPSVDFSEEGRLAQGA